MTQKSSSCQYVPSDTKKEGLSLIHGENLSCAFSEKEKIFAVKNASFSIAENQITSIIGSSGSGKSTLLRLIYGLLAPTSGEVRYRGWLVPTRKEKLIPGHEAMKMVSQGFDDLNTFAKVWDNVASQLSNTNLELKRSKTQEILQKLQIEHLAQKRVADLSGGERQRVAIARALVNEPEVLLMDEPFNQVDAAFRDALQQDIKNIVKDTQLTVLLVSHDPAEVLALSDYLIVMKDGEIIDTGTPTSLYYQPKHPYTAQLLAKSNILSAAQANTLGLQTSSTTGVNQEDIGIRKSEEGTFYIQDIKFRGMYNEFVVTNKEFSLRVVDNTAADLHIGDYVAMEIRRTMSFNAD